MARSRVQFKLGSLMLVIAIVAVGLGVDATRRRWSAFRGLAAHHATEEKLSRMEQQRFLLSIEDQLRIEKREGIESRGDFGSLPLFRDLAAEQGRAAEKHAQMKRYYETRW